LKVGRIDIEPVLDGHILSRLPANQPLPEPHSDRWRDQHGMFRPDGRVESALGAFLIRTADRVALVDAGGGPAFAKGFRPPAINVDDPADPLAAVFRRRGLSDDMIRLAAEHFADVHVEQGALLASLDALGVRAADVTDLIFTHLHFDHIGWASVAQQACFPNAAVRCASADLEFFLAGPDEEEFVTLVYQALPARERLAPVLDRIETWATDETLFPGVDVRLAPGHTPGSSVVVVSDGPARALLLGDVVHCPLELMDDDFNLLVDHDQELADRVRTAYARELEGTDVLAAAAHFPGLRFGRLLAGDSARRWTFA
jgi:glyoxylase-like metal-dependent hydrolase (beta-lactamase superfamily II)